MLPSCTEPEPFVVTSSLSVPLSLTIALVMFQRVDEIMERTHAEAAEMDLLVSIHAGFFVLLGKGSHYS